MKLIEVDEKHHLPTISVPLVKEPHELNQARLKTQRSGDFDKHYQLFIRSISGDVATIDGLEYCKYVLDELALLADKISKESPIGPTKMLISQDDLRVD